MARLSLTLRVALLLPLLTTGVDLTRATIACGAQAQTCLEAAGRGWMGAVAVVLVPLYAVGLAVAVARMGRAAGDLGRPGFARLWALGTAAVGAATAGQLALAGVLGDGGAPLGGNPLVVLAVCAAAGALLALALRVRDAVAALRPRAPRRRVAVAGLVLLAPAPALAVPRAAASPARGRAPPAA